MRCARLANPLLSALLLIGCAGTPDQIAGRPAPLAASANAEPASSAAPGLQPFTLTFLLTADLQGCLEPQNVSWDLKGDGKPTIQPMGGIARIAAAARRIKEENPGAVLLVSTGDDLMGKYYFTFPEVPLDLMSQAGYDILAPGNHEFDKGDAILAQALASARFPVVTSDLETQGTLLAGKTQRSLIKEVRGLRIGFFALMTEQFPLVVSGSAVKQTRSNVASAREMVAALRSAEADLVVALTHIGVEQDKALAQEVQGIDVILGGHSHDYLPGLIREGRTLMINGGEKGVAIARLDVPVTPESTLEIEAARYRVIPLDDSVPQDPEVSVALASVTTKLPKAVVVGHTTTAWDMASALRTGESPVADLITDALRRKFQVDLVLINSGSLRGKRVYPAGDITDEMLSDIDAFRNYLIRLRLKGEYLPAILERSAAGYDEGPFLQVSGLRYTVDLSRPPQELAMDEKNRPYRVKAAGSRVVRAEIAAAQGWTAIDPQREYSVLTSSFLVDRAGDGYFWFGKYGTNIVNTMTTIYSYLIELAAIQNPLDPPAPDGRITVVGAPGK